MDRKDAVKKQMDREARENWDERTSEPILVRSATKEEIEFRRIKTNKHREQLRKERHQ